MFVNFNGQLEIKSCAFEIENNGFAQQQTMQAPKMIIVQQFLALIQQAINTNERVRIKMSTMVPVYSDKSGYRDMESSIEFKNNLYLDKEQKN